jgi:flagellar biosynthesis/type III secretory pathway M-ring protein FliF/YscJ
MPTDFWGNAIFSVIPTIALGLVFWFIMRAIIRADRNERKVYAQLEAEERARREARREADAPSAARNSR